MLIRHGRYALLTKGEVKMPEYWPNSFLWLFMDWDKVEVFKKHTKKEWGWYPAIMTKQAWSIKDKFYSKKISLYQELRMTCLIGEPRKKAIVFVTL